MNGWLLFLFSCSFKYLDLRVSPDYTHVAVPNPSPRAFQNYLRLLKLARISIVKFCFLLVVFPFWIVAKSLVYWSVGDCETDIHKEDVA